MAEAAEYNEMIRRINNDISRTFPYLVREFGEVGRDIPTHNIADEGFGAVRLRDSSYKTLAHVSCDWSFVNEGVKTPGGEASFLVKYWWYRKDRTQEKPWQREAKYYSFLGETKYVPRAYLIEDIIRRNDGLTEGQVQELLGELPALSRAILIEFLGEAIFEKELGEENRKEHRLRKIKEKLEGLVDFQIEATQRLTAPGVKVEDFRELFVGEGIKEKMLDATRAYLNLASIEQLDSGLVERLGKASKVLVNLERTCTVPAVPLVVCHGDFIPPNIIPTPEGDRYIDMQLQFGDGIKDVARHLSWPGVRLGPEELEELVTDFRVMQFERFGAEPYFDRWGLRFSGKRFLKTGVSEELQQDSLTSLLGLIMRDSYFILGKDADTRNHLSFVHQNMLETRPVLKNTELELKMNIRQALGQLLKYSGRFKLKEEEVEGLYIFKEILEKIGVLNNNPENSYVEPRGLEEKIETQPITEPQTAPQQNLKTAAS